MPAHRPSVRLFVCAALAGGLLACESGADGRPAGPPRSAPRDDAGSHALSLDPCAVVPLDEAAAALGRDPGDGSAESTRGTYAADCTYRFERDGRSEYAIVYVYPPSLWMPEARDDGERIPGLGDEAYRSSSGGFEMIHVLSRPDLYLDARAETADKTRALAELAVARFAAARSGR